MPHEQNHSRNQASKAEVQGTRLNQIPAPGEDDTEFSAEEAAEVFNENPSSSQAPGRQQ
ncbi:hypothetical protein [Paenibacillus beijingensis]|uniref:hypothetical protein n=1 Tax=Paenibacillus beijingensis TaxID=1126833 RepID=UPI000A685C23|nr:hypothetical protein [Paenibacillus beijingensis]